jgi:hypothetical protein
MLPRIPPGWFPPTALGVGRDHPLLARLPERFEGFPYLVQRIGYTTIRHTAILPSDWPRARQVHSARSQAGINQPQTCLCLGPAEAMYFEPNGSVSLSDLFPAGHPVIERLP